MASFSATLRNMNSVRELDGNTAELRSRLEQLRAEHTSLKRSIIEMEQRLFAVELGSQLREESMSQSFAGSAGPLNQNVVDLIEPFERKFENFQYEQERRYSIIAQCIEGLSTKNLPRVKQLLQSMAECRLGTIPE